MSAHMLPTSLGLRLSIEKQEGKRKYKSDGGVMVGEFLCVCVCMYVHAQVSEWVSEWVSDWVSEWVRVSEWEWVGGEEDGRRRKKRRGYRTKNKNPTRQCGEKQEFSYIDGLHNFVSWI